MIEVQVQIDVECPSDKALAMLADMSQNTRWQQGMVDCRWTSEPPLRIGSTYDQVARFLGRELRSRFEVRELTDERIRIVSVGGSMPLDITRLVEPLGPDACRVRAIVRGDPGRFFGFAGPLMRFLVRRSVTQDYARLKQLLEG